jgi:hypothetical protein
MRFVVDMTGRVTGENRNDVLGSERKAYSGALVNGVMRVVATFESGATIEYHGTVTAALTFQAAAAHSVQPLYAHT